MRNSIGALATQRYQRRAVRSEARPRGGAREAHATLRPVEPLLLITNSEAGSNDEENLDKALAVLRAATDVEVAATSNQGELDGVLHRRGGRHVVVAGGDGSLHAVVAALHRRHELANTVVGLVPLGTGNDFARGAGIPLDPEDSARLIVADKVQPVDLIVDCLGEVVVNNVHIGVGAQASHNATNLKKVLGRAGYVLGALKAAVKPPFVRLRIEVDDHVVADFAHPILMVAIGNGSRVGGGAEITPEADPKDGKLDVMVAYATSPWDKLGYAVRFRRGTHHERDDVLYLRASRVSVSGQNFYCSADGELYGPERNRTWHVEPGAFSMPLP
jgi:diacylglycerol kinase (ATP)